MTILAASSTQDVKRLLELFPIANLREVWAGIKGTKEEVCFAIAEQQAHDQIIQFVDDHISCCKQHVHVFDRGGGAAALPAAIDGNNAEKVAADHALYILRAQYRVVLKDPLEEAILDFLWPVRIELTQQHAIVRFVVLEKNLGSYFERPYLLGDRTADEKTVIPAIAAAIGDVSSADLHKGVKALWVAGFMDSTRTKYKRPKSTASEAMDEELGIKEQDPDLYARLLDSVLFSTMFSINPDHTDANGLTVSVFSVDPSTGYIAFPRYADRVGDTDRVIRQILTNNQ